MVLGSLRHWAKRAGYELHDSWVSIEVEEWMNGKLLNFYLLFIYLFFNKTIIIAHHLKTTDRQSQKYLYSHTGTHTNCKYLLVADKRSTFSDCYLRVFNISPSLTAQMFIHVRQDENRWLGLKRFNHWKKKIFTLFFFRKKNFYFQTSRRESNFLHSRGN